MGQRQRIRMERLMGREQEGNREESKWEDMVVNLVLENGTELYKTMEGDCRERLSGHLTSHPAECSEIPP